MRANALLGRDAVMRHAAGRAEVRARMWLPARAAGCRIVSGECQLAICAIESSPVSSASSAAACFATWHSIDMLALLVHCPSRHQACSHAP